MAKKFKRVSKKRFPMVRFTLPDIYGDAVFELPDLGSFDLGTQRAMESGSANPMFGLLEEAGVDAETLDALDDLQGEEATQLFEAWANASKVTPGKSKK